jgi:ubiquinol-cytochrome c reductase cytochrome b subunit
MKAFVNQQNSARHEKIPSVPHLLRKEALAAVLVLTLALLIATLFDAPIEGPADPSGIPDEHVKAPWIFVGIQQALRYFPPFGAGVLFPLAALALLGLIPFLNRNLPKITTAIFCGIVAAFLVLTVWGYIR